MLTDAQTYVLASISLVLVIFFVCLNIWYRDYMASLTQAERDDLDHTPGEDW